MGNSSSETTVLIVEDEIFIRMIGVDMLEDSGFRVLEAKNADEALEILKNGADVEVLFTDIRMPGKMDGLELAEFVHTRWPGIKLLITSGHCRLSADEVPDGGRFVAKPYKLETVVEQIRKALIER
ncbi:chemotaxis protein CheY [Novosphingobium barchaimii LL02]|uniref:Chemotaxis protein CheY n=1 Tax=Novosphingobium barchaimii LL02 TaxID=1114963 RepID=A0A0J8APQ6_9SPHN|nr:response regulator [Novosphingobium barchaimii]KMS56440.1 chemotaxis protein CheY [Novosphingobium barchaimii LL02]